MSRMGHQAARDLQSCNHCGHARMDHEMTWRTAYKRTFRARGRCTMDCGCRGFEKWQDRPAKALPKPDGVTASEWASICDDRALAAKDAIAEHWMEYAEYLDIEFDTDANTAIVLPRGSIQ